MLHAGIYEEERDMIGMLDSCEVHIRVSKSDFRKENDHLENVHLLIDSDRQ